ncbi:MAG: PIN domain-containing protein [Pseudolabrys sp.]|nr:PIN domain-containing protein [Pseudolabrys sp.]
MVEPSSRRLVYVDANPIVYALEGPEVLASALKQLFSVFRSRPGTAITSELTLAEVLPKKKIPDREFLDLLVWGGVFDLHPVTREVLVETADYRRSAGKQLSDGRVAIPKLPDAIHAVTAIRAGCSLFLSADAGVKLPETMALVKANASGVADLTRNLQ